MNLKALPLLVIFISLFIGADAQSDSIQVISPKTEVEKKSEKRNQKLRDTVLTKAKEKRFFLTVLPAVGYTLQTGLAGLISANIGYYTEKKPDAKISTISTSVTYSQYNQTIFPFYADLWSKGEVYNLISDNRYIIYI